MVAEEAVREKRVGDEGMRENLAQWTHEATKTERGGGGGRGDEEAISTREEGMANP